MTDTTVTDLRSRIDAIESKKIILTSTRDEIAFAALVDREPAAIKQAAEFNMKIAELTTEEAMLNAALKTALKLEADAKAAQQAKQKHADIEQAVQLLAEAERLALQADQAMLVLHESTAALDKAWSKIRSLSGAGPHKTAVNVHIGRSFRVGLRGLPGVVCDMVPPNERHSVSELHASWSQQVINMAATENKPPISTKPNTKAASKAA